MKEFKSGNDVEVSKNCTFIDKNVFLAEGVKILDNVRIYGKSSIGKNSIIGPCCEITNCNIGEENKIEYSILEGAEIGKKNKIGPFSRIGPGTKTEKNVKIGNFVEVKNSFLKEGVKASHLAYIGDAEIGKNVNIGCGVIFVNYNGKIKQKSIVGDNSFIGSNCNIIAPVTIGECAYITAGTTITKDVESEDFVIGRVRQEHKKGCAKKYLK